MVLILAVRCRPDFVCEALGLRSSCPVAHTSSRPSADTSSTRASLSQSSIIVPIKEYNEEEEVPNEDADTRSLPVSGTPGTGVPGRMRVVHCDLSVVLFVTLFAFRDADRAHLVNVT